MNLPILNIESVGCKYKNYYYDSVNVFKYFIPSLTFTYTKWFTEHNKECYIPILFKNEKIIQNIFSHFNDLYFKIQFKKYSSYYGGDKEHHILDYGNIKRLIQKEYYYFEQEAYTYIIQFYIKYNGYIIDLKYDIGRGEFARTESNSEFYLTPYIEHYPSTESGRGYLLEYIKENYDKFPSIVSFDIFNNGYVKQCDTLDEAIKYIDNINDKNDKINQELESCYSKKSYKLVENL